MQNRGVFHFETPLFLNLMAGQIQASLPKRGSCREWSQAAQKQLSVFTIAEVPVVLRIGPKHPLYNEPELQLSDFWNYTYVDYSARVFMNYPGLDAFLEINPDRVVTSEDRLMKSTLISEGTMYGIGSKLPPAYNQRFHFRNIPLGDLHYILVGIERTGSKRSAIVARYLEILADILENL